MKKIIYGVISLSILILIFMFSAQNGSESGALSSGISNAIKAIVPILNKVDNFESIIRSLAHFSIYLLEGIFLALFLNEFNLKQPLLYLLIFILVYAISDELHQYLASPGRAGEVIDVVKDFLGALCGSLFSFKLLLRK